ncbi:MAG TPA: flagellar motor switch protein FliM [Phycisphaerae bacterium]|nr:flagellar motor switch protein FliM [Phycisphaerae bacterium]
MGERAEHNQAPSPPAEADRWYPSSGPPGAMRWLAEAFPANLSAAVSGCLRSPLGVRLTGLARSAARQFVGSLEELTCSYVLSAESQGPDAEASTICLEFAPDLALVLIERLLGGAGGGSRELRPLTATERRVLHRVAEAVAKGLAAAWPGGQKPRLRAEHTCVPSAAGDGVVLVATFELALGDFVGTMRLCAPAGAFGGTILSEPPRRAADVPLEISAGLEGVMVDEADLAGLAEGDLIDTDVAADGEIVVRIGGIPKFAARLGLADRRRVLTITRRLDNGRNIEAQSDAP